MTIQAIIFDFGGVLLEWNPYLLYRRYYPNDEAIRSFLDEINFFAWNLEQDRGRSFAEGIAALSVQFPQYTALIRAYDEHWIESQAGPIAGSVEILNRLRGNGVSLYALSNWPAEKFRLIRPQFEFLDWFDDLIISGEVGLIKPDPAIYHHTLERIGLSAAECVFIDDSAKNISAARQLGLIGIQFESPEQLTDELRALNLLPA